MANNNHSRIQVFVISPEMLKAIDNLPPDVAVLDLDGGQAEAALDLARKIKMRSPSVGVIVMTSNPDDNQLFLVLKAQAVAYVSKEVTGQQLVEVVRRVSRGERPINAALTS